MVFLHVFLGLMPMIIVGKSSEEFTAALEADDACVAGHERAPGCALELAQLRATKLLQPASLDEQCLRENNTNQWGEGNQVMDWLFRDHTTGSFKHNGFYFEIGAFDGATFSNTKPQNLCLGWGGLLVEANQELKEPLQQNRGDPKMKNIIVNEAVCNEVGGSVDFLNNGPVGGQPKYMDDDFKKQFFPDGVEGAVKVPCNPLWKVFEDHGIKQIDLWSLDVEGGELSVLRTVDFTKIEISAILMENSELATEGSQGWTNSMEAHDILQKAEYVPYARLGPGGPPYKSELWVSKTFHESNPGLLDSMKARACIKGNAPEVPGKPGMGLEWPLACWYD